jgi:hypothetical protein
MAYLKLGRTDEARAQLEAAVAAEGEFPKIEDARAALESIGAGDPGT